MGNKEQKIVIDIQAQTRKAEADIKRLNREISNLKKADKQFSKTSKSVNQMTRSFAQLTVHVAKLAAIYGTFQGLTSVITTFAEFEASITRLGVISGATKDELEALRSKAEQLGESTVYSASQVADGMNALAMAGLSAQEQLASIEGVLNLGIIGMLDLNTSALITVRTMNAFGKSAKDVGNITDTMSVAATDSAQSVEQLGNAYEKVGSVANAFGVSLYDTTAALEVMADAGRVGSEAGTQLKIVMSRFAGNKEAAKYLKELGVSMYDTTGNIKPFKQQLTELNDKLKGLSEEARNVKLGEIAGEEGKASLIVLMNGLDKMDEKVKKLKNSFNSASENARAMQDNLIGSYKQLKAALEGLAIKIGTSLSPALRHIIDDATKFISELDEAEISKFGDDIANLITLLGELGKVFISVTGFVTQGLAQFRELTGVSGGVAVAVGLLISKLVKAKTGMFGFTSSLIAANPVLAGLAVTIGVVTVALEQYRSEVEATTNATDNFKTLTKEFGTALEDVMNSAENITTPEALKAYINYLNSGFDDIKRQIQDYNKLIDNLSSGWVSSDDEQQIQSYKNAIAELNTKLMLINKSKEILTKRGNELTNQLLEEAEAAKKAKREADRLASSTMELTKANKKVVEASIKTLTSRKNAQEKTLGTMLAKEKKYVKDIEKLEQQKLDIHKKYSDDRVKLEQSYEDKSFNVNQKTVNDYKAYKNEQARADKMLSNYKKALDKGNYEEAKRYLDSYDSLISVSAGNEIKVDEKVYLTKKQTAAEFDKDYKASLKGRLELSKIAEQQEIDAINDKLEARKQDLSYQKVQIELQKDMLKLLNEMVSELTGVKLDISFDAVNAKVADLDNDITNLTSKQRKLKIDYETSDLSKQVDEDTKKADNKAVVDVDADTKKSERKFKTFKHSVEGTPVDVDLGVDTTEADSKFKTFKHSVESTPLDAKADLDITQALAKDKTLNAAISKPIRKTIYLDYVETTQRHKLGGIIAPTPKLPRFQDGGHLDNGIGHTTKSGKLQGYGGGDKVKALLEAGEFIIRKEAVRSLGLDRLHQINQGMLPRFKDGGLIGDTTQTTSKVTSQSSRRKVDLNLNLGGGTFPMVADEDIINALERYTRENL